MRWYKLKIDNQEIARLDSDNPSALRIRFTINSFKDATSSVPSVIIINNVSTSVLAQAQAFKGRVLTLEAGLETTSPFCARVGFSQTRTKDISAPLFKGNISAVLTDLRERETQISFLCGVLNTDFKKALGSAKALPFHISQGELIGAKMIDYLNQYITNWNWVDTTGALAETAFQQRQEAEINFKSWNEITDWLKQFDIYIKNENSTGTLYYETDETSTLATSTSDITIEAEDLISQPQFTSGTDCNFSLILNNRYQMSRRLILDSNIVISTASVSASFEGDAFALQGEAKSFIGGTFEPIAIAHIGDSSSIDASAWATEVKAVRETKK